MKFIALVFCTLFQTFFCFGQDQKAKDYLLKMFAAIEQVKTAKYTLVLHERINKTFKDSEFNVKLNVAPFKLYAKCMHPVAGAEALLIEGKNNRKALINPNRFPYINLNLNAQSSLLRKNHHYTFLEIGFDYISTVLKGYVNKYADEFYKTLRFSENIEYGGSKYFILEINYPTYTFVDYRVNKEETISSIAKKILVNDYKILSLNPGVKYYDDVKENQIIKVPNVFAKKIVLYLDKTTLLPVVQTVYDEHGLFGRYEMKNFVLNPAIDPAEFTDVYKDYHF